MAMIPKLVRTIIRADSRYFYNMGWETKKTLERVEKWLNGSSDPEIQAEIVSWMKADLSWIDEIKRDTNRQFWYLLPIVWFVGHYIVALIEKTIRMLE